MGIPGLFTRLRPLYWIQKLDDCQGKIFIDGNSVAYLAAFEGDKHRYGDLREVSQCMDGLLSRWLAHNWDIELVLFDGLTPESKIAESHKRTRDSIKDGVKSSCLSVTALTGSTCHELLSNRATAKPASRDNTPGAPQQGQEFATRVAHDECDNILASVAHNYARNHPKTKTYIVSLDSDFTAFDFPPNMHILNFSEKHFFNKEEYVSCLQTVRIERVLHMNAGKVAYSVEHQLFKEGYVNDKPLEKHKPYVEWQKQQQEVLKSQNFANIADFVASPQQAFAEQILTRNHWASQEAHRVANVWQRCKKAYIFMPIQCEPEWAEFAFVAGQKWRSVAYERILSKAGAQPGQVSHFQEHGRGGNQEQVVDIPTNDKSRAQRDSTTFGYSFGTLKDQIEEIGSWKFADMRRAVIDEVFNNTPGESADPKSHFFYNGNRYRPFIAAYLDKIWNPDTVLATAPALSGDTHMNPTAQRLHNKLVACVFSLKLVEASGIPIPLVPGTQHAPQYCQMDGALFAEMWRRFTLDTVVGRKQTLSPFKNVEGIIGADAPNNAKPPGKDAKKRGGARKGAKKGTETVADTVTEAPVSEKVEGKPVQPVQPASAPKTAKNVAKKDTAARQIAVKAQESAQEELARFEAWLAKQKRNDLEHSLLKQTMTDRVYRATVVLEDLDGSGGALERKEATERAQKASFNYFNRLRANALERQKRQAKNGSAGGKGAKRKPQKDFGVMIMKRKKEMAQEARLRQERLERRKAESEERQREHLKTIKLAKEAKMDRKKKSVVV